MKPARYFITPRVSFRALGKVVLISPEVEDDEGNIIKEAVREQVMETFYKPKIKQKYIEANSYKGEGNGYTSCKFNENYWIIKFFTDEAIHNSVISNLTESDGDYVGSTFAQAKVTIQASPTLSNKINTDGMTDGKVDKPGKMRNFTWPV